MVEKTRKNIFTRVIFCLSLFSSSDVFIDKNLYDWQRVVNVMNKLLQKKQKLCSVEKKKKKM